LGGKQVLSLRKEEAIMKPRPSEEYVPVSAVDWQPFPQDFSTGGIRWKLLHVSPEVGAWTAIFDCPKGSSFASHIHIGPGEYLLTKGKMEVRGGAQTGGATAVAVGYGYEACNAKHDKTYFPEGSEFYMTFLGPLQFIDREGNTLAVVGWEQAQTLWAQQTGQQ
jgi:acetylacetone-cleaving enzyme